MQRFERIPAIQSARAVLLAAWASAASFACSSDHRLGDLTPVDLSEGPEGGEGTASTRDFVAPAELGPPDLTIHEPESLDGSDVTSIGDFDGDGYGDIASRNYYLNAVPYVHIRYGGPRPLALESDLAFAEGGARLVPPAESYLQIGVTRVGDVDGDGFSDLLVYSMYRTEPSKAYLVYGGAARLEGTRAMADVGVLLESPPPIPILAREGIPSLTGSSRFSAGLGDIDGDGFDDFVLTYPQPVTFDDPDIVPLRNVAYLFYGRAERFPNATSWLSADARLSARQWLTLMPTGDVNADGLDDLVLGFFVLHENPFFSSQPDQLLPEGYFWLPGQTQRLSGDHELSDVAAATLPRVEAAGDLDGDGVRDVLVYDESETLHLFYGAAGLFDEGADLAAAAATFQPYTGEPYVNLVPVQDRDGDGDDELVSSFSMGDDGSRVDKPRTVAVLSGTASRMSGAVQLAEPTHPLLQSPSERHYVEGVFSAGDLDGDGADDVITRSGYYTAGGTDPRQCCVTRSVTVDGVTYERYSYTEAQLNIHYGTPGELAAPPR
jgi:hypothetical protein